MTDCTRETSGATPWVPAAAAIAELAEAATACRGCELYAPATQVVFGRGPATARAVVIGEQPGDLEDRAGEPFVGPAGRLLREALAKVDLDVDALYLTNVVKHFRFTQRGKRRLHQSPQPAHIRACRPWLTAELAAVRPALIIVLGATAGRALLGPAFRVTRSRGQLLPWPKPEAARPVRPEPARTAEPAVLATVHPSAVLRAANRSQANAAFVEDLRVAAKHLRDAEKPGGR